MDSLCRLCCSMKFVRNYIFDEATGLYTKISLYMPIKVFKNDELPQKICDKCNCKVNEFYKFCNNAVDIQNRLKAVWAASDGQLSEGDTELLILQNHVTDIPQHGNTPRASGVCEQGSQTDEIHIEVNIKKEPKEVSQDAHSFDDYNHEYNTDLETTAISHNKDSGDSDNVCLIDLQKTKQKKDKKTKNKEDVEKRKRGRPRKIHKNHVGPGESAETNNVKEKKKRGRPKKICLNEIGLDGMIIPKSEPESSAEEWSCDTDGEDEKPWAIKMLTKKRKSRTKNCTYFCCMCYAQCCGREKMLLHYRQHEAELEDAEKPQPPPPPGPGPLRCQRCKTAVAAEEWTAHWARHWARDRRPLRCRLCERTFSRAVDVMRHGASHRTEELSGERAASAAPRDLMCDHCPDKFSLMRQLLAHRTRAHPASLVAPLSLRCARCGRVFAHANSLRRHLAAHEGRRDYLCYICGKSLSSKEHLKYHTRIHTGYKPNVCKTCGKGFAKKCNLTLHERVHTGEKPHACPVCRKTFSQRSTLTIHQRYHSGERPYVCSLCGRGFVARGLLSMHLKTICV